MSVVALTACSPIHQQIRPIEPEPRYSSKTIDVAKCKILEVNKARTENPDREPFSYFPPVTGSKFFLPNKGEITVTLVKVDWADLPGTEEDSRYYSQQASRLTKFFHENSNGQLRIKFREGPTWNRLSGLSSIFASSDNQPGEDEIRAPKEQSFLNAVAAASDPITNFQGTDVVVIAIPRAKEVFSTGTQGFESDNHDNSRRATVFRSDEGAFGNWVVSGTKFMDNLDRSPAWVHWAHEMGHMFGLVAHQTPENPLGPENYYQSPMSGLGLFADQWAVIRTVEGWSAWLLGWLPDDRVVCVDAESIADEVFKLVNRRSDSDDAAVLVVRMNEFEVLLIEHRSWDPDKDMPTNFGKSGVYDSIVIYRMNSKKRLGDESGMALVPSSFEENWDLEKWPGEAEVFTDIFYKQGDAAETNGLRIRIEELDKEAAVVRLTRE